MSDYRLDLIDSTRRADLEAWARAVMLGFLGPDLTEEQLRRMVDWALQDASRVRAVWKDSRTDLGEVTMPAATFRSWDGAINTGNGHLEPANFITDVTVRQTERRRGLLRRLMVTDLREAAERGQALAALTVTEATIYSRFGFGVSTLCHKVRLDISHGFALIHQPSGSIVQLDPANEQTRELWRRVFDQYQRATFGSHDESAHHLDSVLGRFDWDSGKPDTKLRAVCHVDDDGTPDAVMSYTIKDGDELRIVDMVPLNDTAELALWAFIGNHDLLKTCTWRRFNPDSPLRWAISDPRRLVIENIEDGMWLRVLDVPKALQAREFTTDGELTLRVEDPTGIADGTWHLRAHDGHVACETTDRAPDAALGVESLGSIFLGTVQARRLAAAGRIEGSNEAIATLTRLFRVKEAPRSVRYF